MLEHSKCRFLKSVSDSPEFAGIQYISSYSFKTQTSQTSDITSRKEEIIAHFDNGVIKKGKKSYELGIDGQLFMNDLYL